MNFDWRDFTEKDFDDYCEQIKSDVEYDGEYVGCVRVGDLCFDLVIRLNENGDQILTYDLYVGGVDTGYGYSNPNKFNPDMYREEDDYPYDYVCGLDFSSTCTNMSYDYFKVYAEAEFEHFIKVENERYKEACLIDKANEPLKVW